jgi:hypothetical protein
VPEDYKGQERGRGKELSLKCKIDTLEFERALGEYMKHTRKDLAFVINKKALDITLHAAGQTPKAEKFKITAIRDKPWFWPYVVKRIKGEGVTVQAGRRGNRTTFLVQGKFRRSHLGKVARQIINSRVRAITFLRSNWFPAARKLASAVGGSLRIGTGKKGKLGDAIVARPALRVFAQIENAAPGIVKMGSAALQQAFNIVAKDMGEYSARKLQETADKFNARKR